MKANHIISKKFVKYVKKDLVLTMTIINIINVKITVILQEYRGAAHNICNFRYKIQK